MARRAALPAGRAMSSLDMPASHRVISFRRSANSVCLSASSTDVDVPRTVWKRGLGGVSQKGRINMGHDTDASRSSGAVIVIVAVLAVIVLAGLLLVGAGGIFFLRTSRLEQVAMRERARAVATERASEVAKKAADAARVEQEGDLATARAEDENVVRRADRLIVIQLDRAGRMTMAGESMDLAAVEARLRAKLADPGAQATVDVRADDACPFQYVAAMITSCQKLGITRFRIRSRDASGARGPADALEPATVIK